MLVYRFTVSEKCILLYESFLPQWLYSPWWALAFSRSLFQASLLSASVLQFLDLITISFSWPSIYLRYGLPLLRVSSVNWLSVEDFFSGASSSILTT
ncbi:hypothetical protein TNCV_1996601 [Trichonephila clavipes]|uniref:Uncharacterized protein n=1 Tax=Trichonephila clavipes TaxID=2585209 RepID=A0A8X6V2L5_TRICX|nr:hypothetical protein TNCV_1996601 [Trichonephila clavipes]